MICANRESTSQNQKVIGWICNSIINTIFFRSILILLNQEWLIINGINYWKEQRIYYENISSYMQYIGQKTKDTNHTYFKFFFRNIFFCYYSRKNKLLHRNSQTIGRILHNF